MFAFFSIVCSFVLLCLVGWFQDYAYNATFPEFRSKAKECGNEVLQVLQVFIDHVTQDGEIGVPEVGNAADPECFQVRRGVFYSVFFSLPRSDVEGWRSKRVRGRRGEGGVRKLL